MAVRRLHPNQPANFAFSPENEIWVEHTIKNYPPGKQASAVIPLLMRAQEQHHGWLPEPAIRKVAERLGMAYIRVYEIATFYTQFQLAPVGKKAHVQVCGTTPCMLRGAEGLKDVCRLRIHHDQFHLSADGNFSWEEVECAGACANAPMVQIFSDTYEDLTPESLGKVLDGYASGAKPKPGSQTGRKASAPLGGATTLKDPALYDGSAVGSWRKRFEEAEAAAKAAAAAAATAAAATASAAPGGAAGAAASSAAAAKPAAPAPVTASAPSAAPAALAAAASASTSAAVPTATSAVKPLGAVAAASAAAGLMAAGGTAGASAATGSAALGLSVKPALLTAPRGGKGDDLKLIWGVAEKLEKKLNDHGIWHFDQIAKWTAAECAWIEAHIEGMQGRIARDRWLEQCAKLATGWRPEHGHGDRPKG